MKIYFCDICNESIPIEQLASGATTVKDKIICVNCLPKPAPAAATSTARLGPLLGLAVAGLALAAGALVYSLGLKTELDELPDPTEALAAVRASVASIDRRAESIEATQTELSRSLEQVRQRVESLQRGIGDESRRLDQAEQGLLQMRAVVENQGSDRETLNQMVLDRSKLEHSIAEVREAVLTLEGRVADLSTGPLMGGLTAADAAKESSDTAARSFDEETRRQIADLKSRDPGVRWTAVDRLASMRDPALIAHLEPLLEDGDTFVQFRVIQALRELNARGSVQKLIGLLRDGDAIVREEALEALVSLTGHADRFDVTTTAADEREKGVRRWEQWFKENRDRFVGEM